MTARCPKGRNDALPHQLIPPAPCSPSARRALTDPVANAQAALRYYRARYGAWDRAVAWPASAPESEFAGDHCEGMGV